MSKRYSIKMYGADGEDYGAVQVTKGQMVHMFQWLDEWTLHSEKRGHKRGLLFGAGSSTAIYVAWVLLDWLVL